MFAIIKIGNTQHNVAPKDIITVQHIDGDSGKVFTLNEVLLISEGDKTVVGTPFVPGASVVLKILEQIKGEKVHVRRFKSKVRYRKHIGFRPQLTKLEIVSVKTS